MEARLETVLSFIATTATSLVLKLFIFLMNGLGTRLQQLHVCTMTYDAD